MNIGTIVQARMGSSRLPGKIIKEISGKQMLLHCLDRIKQSKNHGSLIVATTSKSSDDVVEKLCNINKIKYYRGSEEDVLDRYYKAALENKLDVIVRITSDCPLIDPVLIDILVDIFFSEPKLDYVSNSFPTRSFPRGFDVEVISFRALEKAWQEDKNLEWREHVTPYIQSNPKIFRLINVVNDEDNSNIRLTVDTPEDLSFLRKLFDTVNIGQLDYQKIITLSVKYDDLFSMNSHIKDKIVLKNFRKKPITVIDIKQYEKELPLILGTAQLGMSYGISNKVGVPDKVEIEKIIKAAYDNGIRIYDTAQAYGKSEENIGHTIKTLYLKNKVKIVTKIDPTLPFRNVDTILKLLYESVRTLNVPKLHTLMIHNAKWLEYETDAIKTTFEKIKEINMNNYFGVSIYNREEALKAIESNLFDIIQLPANFFDERFKKEGLIHKAQKAGMHVHIRSIFLQGLFFLKPENVPIQLQDHVSILGKIKESLGLTIPELVFSYMATGYPRCYLIFGAESVQQVLQNIRAFNKKSSAKINLNQINDCFNNIDEKLINPSLWKMADTL